MKNMLIHRQVIIEAKEHYDFSTQVNSPSLYNVIGPSQVLGTRDLYIYVCDTIVNLSWNNKPWKKLRDTPLPIRKLHMCKVKT